MCVKNDGLQQWLEEVPNAPSSRRGSEDRDSDRITHQDSHRHPIIQEKVPTQQPSPQQPSSQPSPQKKAHVPSPQKSPSHQSPRQSHPFPKQPETPLHFKSIASYMSSEHSYDSPATKQKKLDWKSAKFAEMI